MASGIFTEASTIFSPSCRSIQIYSKTFTWSEIDLVGLLLSPGNVVYLIEGTMKLQTWVLHLKAQLAQVNFFQAGELEGFGIWTQLKRYAFIWETASNTVPRSS